MSLKFVSSVRDPIYGNIQLTECEQEILKLPIMNRLKNIKQLGLAYLSFPGANHTRFEHSIGAMHVAYLMGQSLDLEEIQMITLRLAALLHDVGHPPFSHTLEFLSKMFNRELRDHPILKTSHEAATRDIISGDKDLLRILEDHHSGIIHSEDVSKLAVGDLGKKILDRKVLIFY